jgi:hypothetical protein
LAIEVPKYTSTCEIETKEVLLCIGIQSIKFNVDYYKIEWKAQEDITEQKFFYEPADFSQVLGDFNANLQQFMEDRKAFNAGIFTFKGKFLDMKKLSNAFPTNFGLDIPNDSFVDFVQCEGNECAKGDRIELLYRDLMTVKPKFGIAPGANNAGCSESKNKPAITCSFVKDVLKREPNGFYWIKSECASKPTKV